MCNTLNDEFIVINGVPKGTVLSLILCIIYVAALGHLNMYGKLFSYADDTALIVSETSRKKAYLNAVSDVCHFNEWFLKHN
jgi:hypothetical protein